MRAYQDAAEASPDHFIRYKYPKLLDESREAMAKLLNTPASTLVFVPNATTGVNTVLRNLTYEAGDHILYFATIYGACEKTVAYITETTPASSVKVTYTYPVEDDWLVSTFKEKVKGVEASGGKVKIAIFDAVVSMPGVRMPFERLTAACKELGVLSCIDGAHGVGHVELDLGKLDPDFFVSNCHKYVTSYFFLLSMTRKICKIYANQHRRWLHVPRGCAIFHVALRNQHHIRSTLPTSHGFEPRDSKIASPFPKSAFVDGGKSKYTGNFEFVGTIDNAPYLCVPDAIKWRESIGGEEKIREYCWTLAQQGGQHVADVLSTERLENNTQTLGRCCMTNVRLPISLAKAQEVAAKSGIDTNEVGMLVRDWMSRTLIDDYDTFVQTLFYGGSWWSRLSGQVYLDMADFEWAAETLKKICERVERGDWAETQSKL